MSKNKRSRRVSKIYAFHYVKLAVRSLLFLLVLGAYILDKTAVLRSFRPLPLAVWLIFIFEMLCRFFPSSIESMGCQKQFSRNYRPTEEGKTPVNQPWYITALTAAVWIALNGVIGLLKYFDVIDNGILLLICLFYSVCDLICILFFCPFQTWIMKNRCCTTCRIYNWDFAMMFTPLLFIPRFYTYSLLGCALLLVIRWEVAYRRHPERFSTETNACLNCKNCEEKLCHHKTQLKGFLKKHKKRFFK